MNILKSKIAVGVLSLSLVGGVGTAFANTDAGAQLGTWYDAQLKSAKQQADGTIYRYAMNLLPSLKAEKADIQADAVSTVELAGTDEETRASNAISAAAQAHIDAIDAQQKAISEGMGDQFDTYVASTNNTVDVYANKEVIKYQGEIDTAVNTQGATSLDNVTNNVTAAKNSAVAALTTAINEAKDTINTEVAAEKATAETELKKHFDDKVVELRGQVTEATNTKVQENTDTITAKGAEIETAAKSELDSLVDLIDGKTDAQ